MAPADGPLPAAEAEIPVAARIAELSRPVRARASSGSRGPRSAPSSGSASRVASVRRSPADRDAYLRRLARSRLPHHRELLILMKTLYSANYCRDERVRVAVGYEARCAVEGEPPPAPPSLGDLEPQGEGEQCDVAIVGSGAGGAAAAARLAEAGLDVLVLEAGPHYDRESYPTDPIEATTTLYRDAGLTIAEGLPPVPVPVGRLVGGTTVINSGTCFRAPRADPGASGARATGSPGRPSSRRSTRRLSGCSP